jgi:hypothetical protein
MQSIALRCISKMKFQAAKSPNKRHRQIGRKCGVSDQLRAICRRWLDLDAWRQAG